MNPPKYMHHQNIILSQAQSSEHQLGIVSAIVHRENGDGFVENSTANSHLSGTAVLWRANDNVRGPQHYYQFVPFDNLLAQYRQVQINNQAELDKIEGVEQPTGVHVAGEQEKLRLSRQLLSLWLSLPEDMKPPIGQFYGNMSDDRTLARNVFNVMIRDLADTMRNLKDSLGRFNPTVMMTKTHPLEGHLTARRDKAAQVRQTNEIRRAVQFETWIRRENDQLAQADEVLAYYKDEEDLYSLKNIAGRVMFRVAVFNQLAYNLKATQGHVEDQEVLTTTRNAIQFHRSANYLMLPFRRLANSPKRIFHSENYDQDMLDIIGRIDFLASLPIGEPYRELIRRLSQLGEFTISAISESNTDQIQAHATNFNWLMNYLCYRSNDAEQEKWYRYQL